MLKEYNLFTKGVKDKVEISIKRIKEFEPPEGYYLAFSGGKDSIVIKRLTEMSGVKFDAHFSISTIDPPELVQFIRKHHPDVKRERPEKPLLVAMLSRGFPMRRSRWCCEEYREKGGDGRLVMTGVRWAESFKRRQRQMIETCYKNPTKRFLHAIIDWTDEDVWEFIKETQMPYCKLYDEGFKRIGCLFCPLAYYKSRIRETERYPRFVKLFITYFKKLYNLRKEQGNPSVDRWKDGEEMFWWWIWAH